MIPPFVPKQQKTKTATTVRPPISSRSFLGFPRDDGSVGLVPLLGAWCWRSLNSAFLFHHHNFLRKKTNKNNDNKQNTNQARKGPERIASHPHPSPILLAI